MYSKSRLIGKSIFAAALATLSLIGAAGTALAQSGPITFTVDDDGADCPSAPYHDLASAVHAASLFDPAATKLIKVCPGTYAGLTTIDGLSNLELAGQPGATIVPGSAPYDRSLIQVTRSSGITIRGFRLDGRESLADTPDPIAAISFSESSGLIVQNMITGWREPTVGGNSLGTNLGSIIIHNTQGQAVTIDTNTVHDYQNYAIDVLGVAPVTISNNFTEAANPVSTTVEGIWLEADPAGGLVKSNSVMLDGGFPASCGGCDGVNLFESSGFMVTGNKIGGWDYGARIYTHCVALPDASNNAISGNVITDVRVAVQIFSQGRLSGCAGHADNNAVYNNTMVDTAALGDFGVNLDCTGLGAGATELNEAVITNTITHFGLGIGFWTSGCSPTGGFAPNIITP